MERKVTSNLIARTTQTSRVDTTRIKVVVVVGDVVAVIRAVAVVNVVAVMTIAASETKIVSREHIKLLLNHWKLMILPVAMTVLPPLLMQT